MPPLFFFLLLMDACSGRPPPTPTGCASCHTPAEGAGGSHAAVSCDACHLGDVQAPTEEAAAKETAHVGLEREPGALATVGQTCGACHPVETARVSTSLMATNTGLVEVDRMAFGEAPAPGRTMAEVLASEAPSPSDDHLRRLCGGCHLGARADNRDDAVTGIGTGCAACHVTTGGEGHPEVGGAVPDARCFGCHSRSGRISLSYVGLAEVKGKAKDECAAPGVLPDGRDTCAVGNDVHAEAGLACVDCHLHSELMGDGTEHRRAADATEIRCETCHGPTTDSTWGAVDDPISAALLRQHGQTRAPAEPVRRGTRGTPVWNLRPGGDGWILFAKAGEKSWPVTQVGTDHVDPAHRRLACSTCHAAWAPTCADCHTRFDPTGQQWDFGAAAVKPGAWVEQARQMGFGPPSLAVGPGGRIVPAVPGMILDLDASAAGGPVRQARWFASFDPHTTRREVRSCASCHTDPAAVGLGSGGLDLGGDTIRFKSGSPSPDAWVGHPTQQVGQGTRQGLRSLNRGERWRVLRVGTCISCHFTTTDPGLSDVDRAVGDMASGRSRCPYEPAAWTMDEPSEVETLTP